MTVTTNQTGSTLTATVSGRIDTTTAPEFDIKIKSATESAKDLVLDFEKVDYISSAGLRVLLSIQKIMNTKGSMKVIHVNESVYEIFEVTGFTDILTIEQ